MFERSVVEAQNSFPKQCTKQKLNVKMVVYVINIVQNELWPVPGTAASTAVFPGRGSERIQCLSWKVFDLSLAKSGVQALAGQAPTLRMSNYRPANHVE